MESVARFKTRWYLSLAFKVSVTSILLILFLIFVLSLFFFNHIEKESEAELRKRGVYLAMALSHQAVEPLLYEDLFALYRLLDVFKIKKEEKAPESEEGIVEYAAVYGREEKLLAFVGKDLYRKELEDPSGFDWSGKEALILPKTSIIFEVITPIVVNTMQVGYVRIGITRAYHLKQVRSLKRELWGMAAFLTMLGVLVSLLMTRRYILPLLHVIRGAKNIGKGKWGTQIQVKGRDETAELAGTFNEMSVKLKEAFERVQRTQEKLIRSEKLNAIGKFSANLAHELKNPLTSIKLCIQAMNEPGSSGVLDMEEREMVLNDVQRMDEIISRFLVYAAPPRIHLSPVDINAFLEEVTGKYRPRMETARIRLKFFPAVDLPLVFVDRRKMEEAVGNLCLNAIQAMPDGGEIRIRTSINGSEEDVEIDIEDTGEGIDETIREHLFEPFYTTRKKGTGLGLSIVYQIIQEHGGEISLKDKKEKGTIFSILFPV